jgi:outer membrane protein OmpA-like peptidoglycan-associated protein
VSRGASPVVLLALAALAAGCPSAYQRTYDAEMAKLEAQARAAHAEASRYAAVVYFDVGSAVVSQDGRRELGWLVQKLQPWPQANLLVQGFADTTGQAPENAQLSQARAQAVADVLAGLGVAPSRMAIQGFGTESPAATNATAKGRERNRRVEVTVR